MEPRNRPYVDPATEPGDAGTEAWADDEGEDQAKQRTPADRAAPAADRAAIEGSPADEFLTDEEAISARAEDADPPTGD